MPDESSIPQEPCNHGNEAPVEALENLPISQAGPERHKCGICAYAAGLAAGAQPPALDRLILQFRSCNHDNRAPSELIEQLPDSQAGSARHKCAVCSFQIGSSAAREDHLRTVQQERALYPEEVIDSPEYREGAVKRVAINAYERNPEVRRACIEHYGVTCTVCGLNFEQKYGDIGEGFIHVHHLRALADIGQEYTVDPISDMRPLCPNCHAMIHRQRPPLSIEELRRRLRLE